MTTPTKTPSVPRQGRLASRLLRAVVAAILVVVILVAALAIWYVFLRPAGPPPIGPGAPVIPGLAATAAP